MMTLNERTNKRTRNYKVKLYQKCSLKIRDLKEDNEREKEKKHTIDRTNHDEKEKREKENKMKKKKK